MKKSTLILLLLLAQIASTYAQFKTLAESSSFEEPVKGSVRILQLRNGNSFYFHFTKDGTDIKLFNESHKLKKENHLDFEFKKLHEGNVKGIYDINGNAVVFISAYNKHTPVLYRIILDGKDATLKKEEKIGELKRTKKPKKPFPIDGFDNFNFHVRKDPSSDKYAIVFQNEYDADINKQVEVLLFNPEHAVIARGYCPSPDPTYKYLTYMDMAITGDDRVSVFAQAITKHKRGKTPSAELVIGTLKKGSNALSLDKLMFSKNLRLFNVISRYNPVSGQIILISNIRVVEKRSTGAYSILSIIDPNSGAVTKSDIFYPEKANTKSMELFRKSTFNGLPQNLFINKDGSFNIVSEEVITYIQQIGNRFEVNSELANIAFSTFNEDGEELNTYFIPQSRIIYDRAVDNGYHSFNEEGSGTLDKGNQFKFFQYLNTGSKTYIFINDYERNTYPFVKGRKRVESVVECEAYYYPIAGNEVIPSRNFLFGSPDNQENHTLALFTGADYDKTRNIYVTLKLEIRGKDKKVKLVWLQPQ